MDAEVNFFLSGKVIRNKVKGGKTTGVNRVNSCFPLFLLFSSIHFPFLCAPTSIFFAFLSKKVPEKGVAFQIFYIPLHTDTHSAHAELMLSFSKREIVETRTWEGSGIMT